MSRIKLILNRRRKLDVKLSDREKKYLARLWYQLWMCDWSRGEHLKVLYRIVRRCRTSNPEGKTVFPWRMK